MIRTDQERELDRLRRNLYRVYWRDNGRLTVADTEAMLDLEWLTEDVGSVDTHITGAIVADAPGNEDGTRVYDHTVGVTLLGFREALNFGESERP